MDERVRFVTLLLDGEKMAALCREFAISRKTGYKIFDRYKESGLEALKDSVIREGSAAPAPGRSRIPIVRDGVRNFNRSRQLLELAPDRASFRTEMPPIRQVS